MAIPMWDQLLTGLKICKNKWFKEMDIVYFTFHRKLEEEHEDAMDAALEAHAKNKSAQKSILEGAMEVLDSEKDFWLGLEDKTQEV